MTFFFFRFRMLLKTKAAFVILALIAVTYVSAPIASPVINMPHKAKIEIENINTAKKVINPITNIESNIPHKTKHLQTKKTGVRKGAKFQISGLTGSAPPSTGDWNINSVTVVENEILIVNGSINIDAAGALVLKNSTIYMNLTSDGEHKIDVYGNLTVLNSEITAYNTSNHYVITVHAGAKLLIEDSEISYAGYDRGTYYNETGIWINTNDAVVKSSYFHHNYWGLTLYQAYNVTVVNNTFENITYYGIYLSESIGNHIRNNTVMYKYFK